MNKRHLWLITLLVVSFLLAACGPEMATPTPGDQATDTSLPPTTEAVDATSQPPPTSGELPVDPNDWRTLGSPDAPVTMVEYTDFQ